MISIRGHTPRSNHAQIDKNKNCAILLRNRTFANGDDGDQLGAYSHIGQGAVVVTENNARCVAPMFPPELIPEQDR